MSVSRIKEWNKKNQKFYDYVQACDSLATAVEEVEQAIETLGSDPLNILDLLRAPESKDTWTDPTDKWVAEKLEAVEKLDIKSHVEDAAEVWTEPPMKETVETVEVAPLRNDVHEEGPVEGKDRFSSKVLVRPPVDPDAGLTTRQRNEKRRLEEKNQRNVKFLYGELMKGPMSATEIRAKGQARQISEYALDQARRSVDDILLRTVGFQGATWWYIQGDEHKLPSGEGTKTAKQEGVKVTLTPQENIILNYLPATLAELIGKTHWNVDKVNMNISKLQEKDRIKLNKQNSVWSRV